MKIALINPPMDFDIALGKAKNIVRYTVMIPHGLASIGAVLQRDGIQCKIIDGYAENLAIQNIVDRVIEYFPSAVGISMVTPVADIVHRIAKAIKERNRSIKVILGGPHPSILPDEVMADNNIDFLVRGEGDYSFLRLIRSLDKGWDIHAVGGITFRENGKTVHNKTDGYIADLDELPPPAYELFPMHLYTAPPQWSIASPSYQLIASRGCPYNCAFCCVGMGRQVRFKSAKRVCDEIEYLIKNHKCRQIVFVDTTFPFNLKHAESICSEIIVRGLDKKIVWFTSTRVDIVSQKMLNMMHKAGCRLLTFGVESGNQQILDSVGKNITLAQVADAVKMAHKAGIDVTASYIIGLPGETHQTVIDTIEFAKKLDTLYAQFNIIVPYPGTRIYDYAEKNGLLRNRKWSNYVSLTSMTDLEPPFIAPGLTKEELLALQRKAYNNYYFRPRLIMKHLKRMIFNFDLKKYLSLARVLADTFK